MVRVETVGAKVSKDLKFDAIAALTVATLFMGVFIAIQFRHVSWSFGTGAVIALVHDVLVVLLALMITRLEFDLTTLAALLTVIGLLGARYHHRVGSHPRGCDQAPP